jgi:hypothetical protein
MNLNYPFKRTRASKGNRGVAFIKNYLTNRLKLILLD